MVPLKPNIDIFVLVGIIFHYTIFYNYISIRHDIYLTYWLPYGSEAIDVDTHMRVRIQLEQADRVNPPITAADS